MERVVARLRYHYVEIDLVTGGVYAGDDAETNPETRAMCLESAEAMLAFAGKLKGRKGKVVRVYKCADAECGVYVTGTEAKLDTADWPEAAPDPDQFGGPMRGFKLYFVETKQLFEPWKGNYYSVLIGAVKDGKLTEDLTDIVDVCKDQREKRQKERAEWEAAQEKSKQETAAKERKKAIKAGTVCWYCGGKELEDKGGYKQCNGCGATL